MSVNLRIPHAPPNANFGQRLHLLLIENKMSQTDIANALDVQPQTVCKWVNNVHFPDGEKISAFKKTLGSYVTAWLLNLTEVNRSKGIEWEKPLIKLPPEERLFIERGCLVFELLVGEEKKRWAEIKYLLRSEDDQIGSYFKAAVRLGALRITSIKRNFDYEDRVKKKYNLDFVIIPSATNISGYVVITEIIAYLAAHEVLPLFRHPAPSAIGIGAGYSLLRFAELTVPSVFEFSNTTWYPMMAATDASLFHNGYSATNIARFLANRHPGSDVYELHPDISTSIYDSIPLAFISVNGPTSQNVFARKQFRTADAFVDLENLNQAYQQYFRAQASQKYCDQEIAGEILGCLFTINGDVIGNCSNMDHLIGAKPENLKNIISNSGYVWILASRDYKAPIVKVALEHGYANALVIDDEIANYLLNN